MGPLGTHDAGFTLELQIPPHFLALDLLLGDRSGAEIMPNYSLVCGWLHFHPEGTMLSPA